MAINKILKLTIGIAGAILLIIMGDLLQPIFTPVGTAICQDLGHCVPPKPLVAVVLSPGNLTEQNQTIYLENPQNITAASFAFDIVADNSSTNITAYTSSGNVNISYPYGHTYRGKLELGAQSIAEGDIGIINVTLSSPSKINVTMVVPSADNICTEDIYFSPLNITEQAGQISEGTMTLKEIGNCPSQDFYDHPYTIRSLITVRGS